jgi:hypothetical protein
LLREHGDSEAIRGFAEQCAFMGRVAKRSS